MKQILMAAVFANLAIFVFLSVGIVTVSEGQLRWFGGVFLMIFVCTHGWYRYGIYRMFLFFCITLTVAWTTESVSMATGFPFGHFSYTDKLGEKIGDLPIMIIPAYFFNGYLAWTLAHLFVGHSGQGIAKKHLVLVPLTATCLMIAWNVCFEPIMSTLMGYWTWDNGGPYFGVPISNFAGWFLTVYLIFQLFALLIYRYSHNEAMIISPYYWTLIPVMYAIQGLPYFLYAFFRSQDAAIYQPMALLTVLLMFFPAMLSLIVLQTGHMLPEKHGSGD